MKNWKLNMNLSNFIWSTLIIAITISCDTAIKNSSKKKNRNSSSEEKVGTEIKKGKNYSSILELNKLAKSADPMINYHMNFERSKYYYKQSRISTNSTEEKENYTIFYIWELLYAGYTDKCIAELNFLVDKYQMDSKNMNRTTQSYFNLLALAYLRLGEQNNCLENHNASSCIIPLDNKAQHINRKGSEKAIELYRDLLKYNPTDLQSKWLYNLAHMTLGTYPHGVEKENLIHLPTDNKNRQFKDIGTTLNVALNSLSGASCVDDFNNDGILDIITSGYGYEETIHLYLGTTDGFIEATDSFQLNGMLGGLNMIHADFDNDGFKDIFVLRGGWLGAGGKLPNTLLKNIGGKYFKDVTKSVGIQSYFPTQTAVWSDFNLDGYLDLFIGNEMHPCELYLNNSNGTFTNITKEAVVNLTAFVKSVATGDVNNDGYPDLYVSVLNGNNALYVNQPQQNGSILFKKETSKYGVEKPEYSFTSWFCDINNDGWDDLFVGNYDVPKQDKVAAQYAEELLNDGFEGEKPRVYINNQEGGFEDKTQAYGMEKVLFAMGANFGDLDNDGYLDFFIGTGSPDYSSIIPNRVFRNNKGVKFEEITLESGLGNIQKGHAVSFADFDNDGDEDIYMVLGGAFEGDSYPNALYVNLQEENNNWIAVNLIGTKSNASAIGAKIELIAINPNGTESKFYRTVSTGGSFGGSTLSQSIGIGKATKIKELNIWWPNKKQTRTSIKNLEINQFYVIKENKKDAIKLERDVKDLSTTPNKKIHQHMH